MITFVGSLATFANAILEYHTIYIIKKQAFPVIFLRNTSDERGIYHDMIIGVMDSGIGGLNVLAALIRHRTADHYLYFADGANLPYGDLSPEALRQIALDGVRRLTDRGAQVIVFGCNTLSVCALDYVRKQVSPPVFGLIPRPELCGGKTLLITTPATALFLPKIESNVTLLTPASLARTIDEEYPEKEETRKLLSPLIVPYGEFDSLYLGCSHYLYAKPLFSELMPRAAVIDGTEPLAALVRAVLPAPGAKNPSVTILFSGKKQPERYYRILRALLD